MSSSSTTSVPYNPRKVLKRALTASLGFFSMGYCLNIFNSSQTCISSVLHWGENEELLIAIMTAMIPFGALFGVLSSGYLTKYYGKRTLLIYSDILTIVGSIISYIPNTITLGIGRFILGFTSGCFSTICGQYTAEFTPPEVYAKMGYISPLASIVGNLFSNVVCLPLPIGDCGEHNQYFVFLIFLGPGIASFLQLLVLMKVFVKESPKWLISQQQFELATHSYESIYNADYAVEEMKKIQSVKESEKEELLEKNREVTFLELVCCKKGTTKGMRLGTMLLLLHQLSGISAIMFYSTLLYQDIGEGLFFARALTVIGTAIRIPPVILLLPHVKKFSAKTLIILGHLLMGSNLFIIFFLFGIHSVVFLVVGNIFMYQIVYGCTVYPIAFSYSSQVMPDKGLSLGMGLGWVVVTVFVLAFPFMINLFGLNYVFLILAGCNFIGIVYLCFDMIDVRGKTKAEIQDLFSNYR